MDRATVSPRERGLCFRQILSMGDTLVFVCFILLPIYLQIACNLGTVSPTRWLCGTDCGMAAWFLFFMPCSLPVRCHLPASSTPGLLCCPFRLLLPLTQFLTSCLHGRLQPALARLPLSPTAAHPGLNHLQAICCLMRAGFKSFICWGLPQGKTSSGTMALLRVDTTGQPHSPPALPACGQVAWPPAYTLQSLFPWRNCPPSTSILPAFASQGTSDAAWFLKPPSPHGNAAPLPLHSWPASVAEGTSSL